MKVTLVCGSWAARVELSLHGLLRRCAAATPRLPGPERHRAAGTRCAPPGAPLSPQTPAAPPASPAGLGSSTKRPRRFHPAERNKRQPPAPKGAGARSPPPPSSPALPRPAHPRTARAGRRPPGFAPPAAEFERAARSTPAAPSPAAPPRGGAGSAGRAALQEAATERGGAAPAPAPAFSPAPPRSAPGSSGRTGSGGRPAPACPKGSPAAGEAPAAAARWRWALRGPGAEGAAGLAAVAARGWGGERGGKRSSRFGIGGSRRVTQNH